MKGIEIDKVGVEMPEYASLIELSTTNLEPLVLENWFFRNF